MKVDEVDMWLAWVYFTCVILQVDSALQSMMNENSMDYSAKFADLAAQIAASAPSRAPDHL